jgi:pimeloyl-ACP methyl ester carboxylesterase
MADVLRSATCRSNGFDLHYVHAGEGPPLVFLHGVLGSHKVWADLAAELAHEYTVIVPDLFGHGASDKHKGDYSLSAHAASVRDVVSALGLGPVTIIGHSLGGGISLQFSYLFPERVDALVLVASGGLGREVSFLLRAPTMPGSEWLLPVIANRFARHQGNTLSTALKMVGFKGGPDVAEIWHGFESLVDGEARRAFLATIRSVVGPDGQRISAKEILPAISVPTLLVWGARDRLIPKSHAEEAVNLIPDARLVVFERGGHFPHLDEPEHFATLMRDFTAEVALRKVRRLRTDAKPA